MQSPLPYRFHLRVHPFRGAGTIQLPWGSSNSRLLVLNTCTVSTRTLIGRTRSQMLCSVIRWVVHRVLEALRRFDQWRALWNVDASLQQTRQRSSASRPVPLNYCKCIVSLHTLVTCRVVVRPNAEQTSCCCGVLWMRYLLRGLRYDSESPFWLPSSVSTWKSRESARIARLA